MLNSCVTILLAGLPIAYASPAFPGPSQVPNAIPTGIAAEPPLITPSPSLQDPTKTVKLKRGVVDDIKSGFSDAKSDVQGYVSSQLGALPSYVADGVANFFQGFPVGDDVKSSLGLDDEQIAALPTQVLNIPYAASEWIHMQKISLISMIGVMETGQIRDGTSAFAAMCTSSQI